MGSLEVSPLYSSQEIGRPNEADTTASPFLTFTRYEIKTPTKSIQVELATIFSQHKGRDSCVIYKDGS